MCLIERIVFDPRGQAAIGAAHTDLRRRLRVAEGVYMECGVVGESRRVAAVALADASRRIGTAAVELECVDLRVRHEIAIGLHVDQRVLFIHG